MPVCRGGFDRIFDCFGSTASINQALRVAAGGAGIVLIGIQIPKLIDWTPVWVKGLHIIGDLGYGIEEYRGERKHTFDIVMELMEQGRLDTTDLTTHMFTLDEYRTAIQVNMKKGQYQAIKTVFDLTGE